MGLSPSQLLSLPRDGHVDGSRAKRPDLRRFDVRRTTSIDSYRFLDFATRQVMKAWAARQERGVIPFTPLARPLRECTMALVSTAGVARNDDQPFDQERERRDPWWGDPRSRGVSSRPATKLERTPRQNRSAL